RTLVFYESGRRVGDALRDMIGAFGEHRPATLARELTKAFESVYRGSLGELEQRSRADPDLSRGEIVLVVAGNDDAAIPASSAGLEQVVALLVRELPASRAARIAAAITGCKRAEAYAIAARLDRDGSDGEGPV
ncbi:MAG: rRNA (cytidine-2'-O-)-methyltransferase, partial [Gammaproteobacteria bacterium]